jgi:hypothetical protein
VGGFLRENWFWLLAPFFLLVILVALALLLPGEAPTGYAVF